jgi:hypothetical protein
MTIVQGSGKKIAPTASHRYKSGAVRMPLLSRRNLEFCFCLIALAMSACEKSKAPRTSGALSQCGYLWQRDWTTPAGKAFVEAQSHFDAITILGGEIIWENQQPHFVRSTTRWNYVRDARKPITLALRIAPFGGPFTRDDANARFIMSTAESLLDDAAQNGARLSGFQIDFDCAQKSSAAIARGWRTCDHSLGLCHSRLLRCRRGLMNPRSATC